MDSGSVFRREQFRFIGKLSKEIHNSPLLRLTWEKAKTKKAWCAYDDIFKANYNKIRYNNPDGVPVLFPCSGFKLINPVVQKTITGYDIYSGKVGVIRSFNLINTRSVTAIGIFLCTNPDLPEPGKSLIVASFSANMTVPDIFSPLNINMMLTRDVKTHFDSGSIIKAFFTIAFLDKNEHPVSFSDLLIYTSPPE
jgi:hypothetical protein